MTAEQTKALSDVEWRALAIATDQNVPSEETKKRVIEMLEEM